MGRWAVSRPLFTWPVSARLLWGRSAAQRGEGREPSVRGFFNAGEQRSRPGARASPLASWILRGLSRDKVWAILEALTLPPALLLHTWGTE